MPEIYKTTYHNSLLLKLEDISANLEGKSRSYFRLFHINRIEDFRQFLNIKQPPYRKSVTDFILLTQGTSTRTKGLDKCELSANTFFCVPAYQIRTVEAISEDVKGFFCHFDTEIFKKSFIQDDILKQFPFLQYIGTPLVHIPDAAMPSIINLCERLEKEYKNENPNDFNLFSTYLLALFFELNRCIGSTTSPKDTAALLTQRYKDALMQHIYDIHTVADFAAHLAVSQTYLNRCLQATIGKNAHDLLNDMLLLEAKSLLKQTDLSISEIAYKIGKKDHSDFSRFFKTHTGMTPKEFRK
ncbi:MAG: AraC family transcriptional regulator [Saprospiraceae bacterium]|nr:AraC family transcriptional regulator [Saprospiraceae bacterium]